MALFLTENAQLKCKFEAGMFSREYLIRFDDGDRAWVHPDHLVAAEGH